MNQDTFTQADLKYLKKTKKDISFSRRFEHMAASVPPAGLLALALGSMTASLGIAMFTKKKTFANFVGLWTPAFLLLGIYNQIAKIEGYEKSHQLH